MRITYDPEANAAFIYLKETIAPGGVARTEICDVETKPETSIILCFDSEGLVVGIEILGATRILPPETLMRAQRLDK